MTTNVVVKENMQRIYNYKKIGLFVLILTVLWVGFSYAEYGKTKVDRTVVTPNGNDRLLIYLIGVSKDGLGYDFHSLVWEKRSSGVWNAYKTITRQEFETNVKHRLWIEDAYSLEPETGYAILKVAEEYPSETSNGFNIKRSWRKWDIANNVEVQFLRECKDAMEPYVLDEKYRTSVKQAKERSVYIDVIFGSDEYAPKINKAKKPNDDAVRRIGEDVIKQLESKQIAVYLPSTTRTKAYLEERLFDARSKYSKLYLAIQSSTGTQDCMRLYIPSREGRYSEMKKWKHTSSNEFSKSIVETMEKQKIDDIVAESSRFADMLIASTTTSSPSLCIQKQNKRSYTLDNTDQPTILLDFVVSKEIKKSSFLQNEEIRKKLATTISKAVEDFFSSTAKANND